MWGTFATICYTICNLPPSSQASIWDVAEAYRTIPIMPNQWPGLMVKLCDEDSSPLTTIILVSLQLEEFMANLEMLLQIFFVLKESVPSQNGLMTIFSSKYSVSTSPFTIKKQFYGIRPLQTMEVNSSQAAGSYIMVRTCQMTYLQNLMRMLQIWFKTIQMPQFAPQVILCLHIAILTSTPFQKNWEFHGNPQKQFHLAPQYSIWGSTGISPLASSCFC